MHQRPSTVPEHTPRPRAASADPTPAPPTHRPVRTPGPAPTAGPVITPGTLLERLWPEFLPGKWARPIPYSLNLE